MPAWGGVEYSFSRVGAHRFLIGGLGVGGIVIVPLVLLIGCDWPISQCVFVWFRARFLCCPCLRLCCLGLSIGVTHTSTHLQAWTSKSRLFPTCLSPLFAALPLSLSLLCRLSLSFKLSLSLSFLKPVVIVVVVICFARNKASRCSTPSLNALKS